MGQRDELQNIMRSWGMCKVAVLRKWGWAGKMRPLCEWKFWGAFYFFLQIDRHKALPCCWCGTLMLCALLAAGWGDYRCAEHAVPGSATQSLKPATQPLECLVWGTAIAAGLEGTEHIPSLKSATWDSRLCLSPPHETSVLLRRTFVFPMAHSQFSFT